MSTESGRTLLTARSLGVRVGGQTVCRNLTLQLEPGQCWGLLGPNGVGKTTLLLTLAGLREPAAGCVLLQGRPLRQLPRRRIAQVLGLMPQDSFDPFPASVLDTALTGRHPHLAPWRWEDASEQAVTLEALRRVDLEGLAERPVQTLSGGERRRLALATLLAQDPDLALLDEPLNHLDPAHQLRTLELLRARCEAERAVLMVLHDLNLALRFCSHLLLLFPGGEVRQGPRARVGRCDLERLYGHPLVEVHAPHGVWLLPR